MIPIRINKTNGCLSVCMLVRCLHFGVDLFSFLSGAITPSQVMSAITMHITENQEATIMVRSTKPVTLKFSRMVVHISEVDGYLVLKQCPKSAEIEEPIVVTSFAGGSFDQVNEELAYQIERVDIV